MKITDEYKRQANWRNWETYLDCLPIEKEHTVLDLGCGIGNVSKLLAKKSSKVIGIDFNQKLLETAELENKETNITFIKNDLKKIEKVVNEPIDGIWSSFTVAYIPDFTAILQKWIRLLKPNGWIALVEIDDLFGHSPINSTTRISFTKYYDRQLKKGIYDFKMGGKLRQFIKNEGLTITHEENKFDKELSFSGPADPIIYSAWNNRLTRMFALKDFLGEKEYLNLKSDFLNSLKDRNHSCEAKVKYIIAKK